MSRLEKQLRKRPRAGISLLALSLLLLAGSGVWTALSAGRCRGGLA